MRGRALALVPLLSAACVPQYKPPTADQPHAVVKLRRVYDTRAGSTLSEAVDIDGHSALREHAASDSAASARIDALLAHPLPSTVVFRSAFTHMETQLVHESYQEPHTVYEQQSYDCSSGFGTSKSYRTCSRSVSRTSYETKYRYVHKQVTVTDAACDAGLRFAPQNQHVYLLQYTYHAQSVCSLACYEQVPEAGGTFKNLPCPVAPPAAD